MYVYMYHVIGGFKGASLLFHVLWVSSSLDTLLGEGDAACLLTPRSPSIYLGASWREVSEGIIFRRNAALRAGSKIS